MSSTGRGPRLGGPDDHYVTPSWVVRRLLETWKPRPGWLCEPAAGEGAIIHEVNNYLPGRLDWLAVECRATAEARLLAVGVNPCIADFLTWEPPASVTHDVSTVITNPPFKLCEEFIRRGAELFPDADLVFLTRLGFLASEKRVALWRDIGMPDVYVLPNRPSFTPDGKTDSADYCWLVFQGESVSQQGAFEVLKSTPAAERRPKVAGKQRRAA